MQRSIIFIAGAYGVGKTTLCEKVAEATGMPHYSASDLISKINGEKYGANKIVKDKDDNQRILLNAISDKLKIHSAMIVSGHFCIIGKNNLIEKLPEFVFSEMKIKKAVLLTADTNTIIKHLSERDRIKYDESIITCLLSSEKEYAEKLNAKLHFPLLTHEMQYNNTDVEGITSFIKGEYA